METFKAYYQMKDHSEADIAEIVSHQIDRQRKHGTANRRKVIEICRALGKTLASHDDTTEQDVI